MKLFPTTVDIRDEDLDAAMLVAKSRGCNLVTSPRLIMLVGVPASGKSTWTKEYLNNTTRPTVVISSDNLIDEFAKERGITYDEAFPLVDHKELARKCMHDLRDACAKKQDIIVDRTNMRIKSRRKFKSSVTKDYAQFAVLFVTELDEISRRLKDRSVRTGKSIPWHVINSMLETYEAPENGEFDLVGTY